MNSISGKKILYVWKGSWPWDIRIDKICTSLGKAGADVRILAKLNSNEISFEKSEFYSISRHIISKINIFTLPIPYNFLWKKAIEKEVVEFEPDIIMVREIMIAQQSAAIAKKYSIPVIMDMAENYPALMKLWKKYRHGIINRILFHFLDIAKFTEKITVNKMNGIIVVCNEQIDRLYDDYTYNRDLVSVVHNTPELSLGKYIDQNSQANNERITFCHHGHLTDEKKIDIFLKSLLSIPNHRDKFKFIIAGSGESLTELQQIHKSFGSPDNIIFLGEYKFADLAGIIKQCDYGVLPYLANDFNNFTIHNKIFDYFAFGKPVIVSNAPPLKRLVNQTNAGLSFDFSSIESSKIMFDEIENTNYNNLSHNTREAFTSQYNWENDSQTLINFLSNFLKKSK